MEPDVRYTYVGAALVGLVAALVFGFLWLTEVTTRGGYQLYTIYFQRQPLDGLQVGGDVTTRGIKVGQVMGYELSPTEINKVRVTVRVDRDVPVTETTQAVVSRSFVTGIARISLVTPLPAGPPLTAAPHGERYPVIREGSTPAEQLQDAATRAAAAGTTALERLNELLDERNRKAFAEAVANIRDLAAGLNERLAKVDTAIASLERSADAFGRSGERIAASIEKVAADAGPVAREAERALREVADAAATIQRETAALARQVEQASGGASAELRATAQELRTTADLLDRTLNRLRDPRAVIFGPNPAALGPGERLK
ncbi:MAG: MlaD family protein [Burkholderiales bacterium]|nr:MlaD family protein [Burkholderiales bacterium]